ncbi:phosphotransferase [Agrobacterium fabrum]|uniref:phosphotransferase n=1 Tax=Agrobacterium fabrum TaxID=1176649 RepID=UPI001572C8D8|nr:phosphotransferase [Agrobacterium fabrum]WCK80078.1 phosphotransferase [Agrobacterium fabrum]
MAVFTEMSDSDIRQLQDVYSFDRMSSVTGIVEGDTETTYALRAGSDEYILTIFETDVEAADLERAFRTMETLRHHDVPCPAPKRTRHGAASFVLGRKLAALVSFVEGNNATDATVSKCLRLGHQAATVHRALNPAYGLSGTTQSELPRGWIHGALNKNNVMFTGDAVTGIINFRLRHTDFLVSEIADIIAEWAIVGGLLDRERAHALLEGYDDARPLTLQELASLPLFVVSSSAKLAAAKQLAQPLDLAVLERHVTDVVAGSREGLVDQFIGTGRYLPDGLPS